MLYEFGSFTLDPAERILLHDGKTVALTPKVFDLLLLLAENPNRLLEKEDLMRSLWQDSFVEESNLSFNISVLRKALGEDPKNRQYIETVPKRGYRFIAGVSIVEQEPDSPPEASGKSAVENVSEKESRAPLPETREFEIQNPDSARPPAAVKPGSKISDAVVEIRHGSSGSAEHSAVAGANRHLKRIGLAAICLAAAGAVGFGLYQFTREQPAAPLLPVQVGVTHSAVQEAVSPPMKVTQLTTARNATYAAISPDGKYVAYILDEARKRSLWLRQITTNSDMQLIAPADVNYLDVIFSPDGDYIYFFKAELNAGGAALYQIPVLGGTPRKLIEKAPSPALSPDGKQFAFTSRSESGEVVLSVANALDGGEEQRLIARRQPGYLLSPAWSPDGKTIVCVAVTIAESGPQVDLIEVRLDDKTERIITSERWRFISQVAFLPDKSGVLVTVSDFSFGPYQVWHVSYPEGKARQVTNDLSNYSNISLTSDSKTLVTVQSDIRPFVWVTSPGAAESGKAKQITSSPGTRNDYWGFSWTPDGKIVYVSTASGNHDIWIMNPDGTAQKQLTFDTHSDFDPSVSPDGRHIVFASERSGITKIWEMDISGENLRQVTRGATSDYLPYHAPDGQAIVYTSSDTRNQTLWKISLAAESAPVQLTRSDSTWGAVSPDGTLVAAWNPDEKTGRVNLVVFPIEGGAPVKSFTVPLTAKTWADIHWTPDGRGIAYIDTVGTVGNIWQQPVDGGAPKQLTNFKTDRIFRFAWSADGKRIVCSRGIETNDVVLISNFR